MYKRIEKATSFITKQIPRYPDIAIILGSGLGGLADLVTEKVEIDYRNIPDFPKTTVVGHAGKLIFGYNGIFLAS